MPGLKDLAIELLHSIIDLLGPVEFDNLLSSCDWIPDRVGHHHLVQRYRDELVLSGIENARGFDSGGFHFPTLLAAFLHTPKLTGHVQAMVINPWKSGWSGKARYCNHDMQAFKKLIENTKTIPVDEKKQWVSKLRAGNENPIIALLLHRIHNLTSLVLILKDRTDFFFLKTVQRIAKEKQSPSLSRLRKVEVRGSAAPTHTIDFLIAFAALPSLNSLKGHRLIDGPFDSAEPAHGQVLRNSSVQNLQLKNCRFSPYKLSDFIRTVEALRSFKCKCSEEVAYPSFTWARDAVFEHASTSLEDLTIRLSNSIPDWRNQCSFKDYPKLRTLKIDFAVLIGTDYRATHAIFTALPDSLEILTVLECQGFKLAGLAEFVRWVLRRDDTQLPSLSELHLHKVTGFDLVRQEDITELSDKARAAGFVLDLAPTPIPSAPAPSHGDWYRDNTPETCVRLVRDGEFEM